MRKLYFLLPGTGGKFACGGLWAELKTLRLVQHFCPAEVVTYRQREKDTLFLDDLLQQPSQKDVIFVVSWGFDVPRLVDRLRSQNVLYHAHSAEYGFRLPSRIPILTVSRNTMGYWGQRSPHALVYYLPNQISDEFTDQRQLRDIDVLVQARKSSTYLLNQLIPELQKHCQVYVVNSYVEDIAGLFNRARVYLYDSAEYWAVQGVTEGFGLQPLEAMACGCRVFSSVNHGLSDYLDPGFNCEKIAGYSKAFDLQRILKAVQTASVSPDLSILEEYRQPNILMRLPVILEGVNAFFDSLEAQPPAIPPLQIRALRWQRVLDKLQKKMRRSP